MKKLMLMMMVGFLATSSVVNAQSEANAAEEKKKINWITLEEAQKLQKENPKKILIDVYTPWCGPCKMLNRNTFSDARVIDYINENYYAVKFNAESADPITFGDKEYKNPHYDKNRPPNARNYTHQLSVYFKVSGYPTILFIDDSLKTVGQYPGYRGPDQMLKLMKSI